jgi:Zn-dependent protease
MTRLRIVGLDVRIGAGWLLSYLLIAGSLVLWFEMPDVPRLPSVATLIAVVAVPALLLPAVVAHELAHALVARHRGAIMYVVDLRLMGVPASSDVAGRAPATEALVALAGPAVSGVLGLVALGVAALASHAGTDTGALVAWTCTCLAAGNLLLAAVSLYPGAPLDGGQVVHAVARWSTPDAAIAARRTATVGVVAGWLVMIGGLGVAFNVDTTAGLWLIVMGWFLGRASRQARAQDQLIRLTAGLDVGDALQQDVAVVSSGLTLDTLLAQNQLTSGPDVYTVKQGDVLLGVIDIRDIRAIPARRRMELRVADRMRPLASLRSVREDQDLWDAVTILEQGRLAALLVVDPLDPGHLMGLVTRASVTRLLRSRRARLPDDSRP